MRKLYICLACLSSLALLWMPNPGESAGKNSPFHSIGDFSEERVVLTGSTLVGPPKEKTQPKKNGKVENLENFNIGQTLREKIRDAANIYCFGLLGGAPEWSLKIPFLFPGINEEEAYRMWWVFDLAYPYTRMRWNMATIERVLVDRNLDVIVEAVLPHFRTGSAAYPKGLPRCVEEWILSEIFAEQEEYVPVYRRRELRFDAMGRLALDRDELTAWMQEPYKDLREALDWCLRHPEKVPGRYVVALDAEVRMSVRFSMPDDIRKKISVVAARARARLH